MSPRSRPQAVLARHRDRRPREHAERGSSTVAMVGIVAAVGMLLLAVCLLGHVAMCNHRAAKAADLAALAAADVARGLRPGIPCEEAEAVAAQNQARLVSCAEAPENPEIIDVAVEVPLAWNPALSGEGALGPARGVSRAGPPGA